ncbi:platelet-derived growth factor receptor beta-like isoform X3 [Puntigrus tetrazona]|uniref:platelet-derived growth factor receptor beta-like isoform X3 n=1 Tax=Puntigrus tetrazona TaxID=1606681 RepID=UPI001C8A33FA|nr:platelet-derived growth factor receptor beta-like isoform X3 [Puntigrus tetrazona]
MKSFSRSLLTAMTTDPKVWFLENDHIMVTKTREEGTIPCLVTNPLINVTLYEKDTEVMVEGSYNPIVGFTAALEDRNYKCKGELNGEEKESIGFYVFSIVASKALDTYISASKTVLKQGEMLNVNCTVHGAELVYFSWDFPHKDKSDAEGSVVDSAIIQAEGAELIKKFMTRHLGWMGFTMSTPSLWIRGTWE